MVSNIHSRKSKDRLNSITAAVKAGLAKSILDTGENYCNAATYLFPVHVLSVDR